MPDEEEPIVDLADVYGDAPAEPGPSGYVHAEALLPAEWGRGEPLPAAERYETFETCLWAYYLAPVRDEASSALYALEEAVRDGRRPSASEVRAARRSLNTARALVERHYASLASGVEPWGSGVGGKVPYGALKRQLEAAGYTVERAER